MSEPRYPTDFFDDKWGRIHAGHGLPTTTLLDDVRFAMGPCDRVRVSEVWLSEMPRVKYCGRYDNPCDMDGEWHRHWFAARPSPETAFTLAYPAAPVSESQQ